MRKFLKNILLILPLILLISCGEEELSIGTSGSSNVPLTINVDVSEEQQKTDQDLTTAQELDQCIGFVSIVRVVIQGDFPPFSRVFSVGQRIVIFLPPGEVRISISLENDSGEVCCFGEAVINLVPDVANQVTIPCEPVSEICNNGQDDNGNGLVDCDESTCEGFPCDESNPSDICINNACTTPPSAEANCDDGVDNDFDSGIENGGTDCEDIDCADDPACAETVCDDGIDNEGDGDTDCDDLDCSPDPACVENNCNNFIDDDNDGNIDCEDPDCSLDFECQEVCSGGVDEDSDGFIDCQDPDCSESPSCLDCSECGPSACLGMSCGDGGTCVSDEGSGTFCDDFTIEQ